MSDFDAIVVGAGCAGVYGHSQPLPKLGRPDRVPTVLPGQKPRTPLAKLIPDASQAAWREPYTPSHLEFKFSYPRTVPTWACHDLAPIFVVVAASVGGENYVNMTREATLTGMGNIAFW